MHRKAKKKLARNMRAKIVQANDPSRKFRWRRGVLVEIPQEWVGQTLCKQTRQKRASKRHKRRSASRDECCGLRGHARVPRERDQGHRSRRTGQKATKRPPRAWPRKFRHSVEREEYPGCEYPGTGAV